MGSTDVCRLMRRRINSKIKKKIKQNVKRFYQRYNNMTGRRPTGELLHVLSQQTTTISFSAQVGQLRRRGPQLRRRRRHALTHGGKHRRQVNGTADNFYGPEGISGACCRAKRQHSSNRSEN